jgi:hypothetical protein
MTCEANNREIAFLGFLYAARFRLEKPCGSIVLAF